MSMISDSLSPDIAESVQIAHSVSDSDIDDCTVIDTIPETETVSNLAACVACYSKLYYIFQYYT